MSDEARNEAQEREARLWERYDLQVDQFFHGLPLFQDRTTGHVWISTHHSFDTLTVEPPEGGQYELAVRIPIAPDDTDEVEGYYGKKYRGYVARDGYMTGINTSGH